MIIVWIAGSLTLQQRHDCARAIRAAGVSLEAIGALPDMPGQLRLDFTDGTTQAQQDEAKRLIAAFGFVYKTSKPIFTKEIKAEWQQLQALPLW